MPLRAPLPALLLALVFASGLGCCRLFQSDEERYRKALECSERLTSDKSVEILRDGYQCCAPLPETVRDREAAKRFYLEEARALKPAAPEPDAAIGLSYWEGGQFEQALGAYREAARKSSRPFAYRVAVVTMLRLTGRYDEALAEIASLRRLRGVDAEKVADYLQGRVLYEQGRLPEAAVAFQRALAGAEKTGSFLGPSPYTMQDAWFYTAQIRRKTGDPLGGHEAFKAYLAAMHNPEFQTWYANTLLPRHGADQAGLYDAIEENWVRERQ